VPGPFWASSELLAALREPYAVHRCSTGSVRRWPERGPGHSRLSPTPKASELRVRFLAWPSLAPESVRPVLVPPGTSVLHPTLDVPIRAAACRAGASCQPAPSRSPPRSLSRLATGPPLTSGTGPVATSSPESFRPTPPRTITGSRLVSCLSGSEPLRLSRQARARNLVASSLIPQQIAEGPHPFGHSD